MISTAVTSSVVQRIGYDAASATMEVLFQPNRRGESILMHYYRITPDIYDEVLTSKSVGNAVNYIRQAYPGRKVGWIDVNGGLHNISGVEMP